MPFYNNIYYPLSSEPRATHSSAGIPSLLSSPQSQPSSGSQGRPDASAMSTAFAGTPFKFRTRHESVDWRRISSVDVERVACELDFQTLQEHVAAVAFCSLEGERCGRCHSQVDPALLKLFRLSQLIVEYLLHSQDCLASSLEATEQQLQAQVHVAEQLREDLRKHTQDAKSLKEELKQRKKIITSQQAMISAGLANYHKCQRCEKAFMNASFLHSHMQRRHPMEHDIKLMTDNQKKVHTMKLEEEVNRLQDQLTQMEAQQKDHTAVRDREKDLTQKQEEFMKQMEAWKEDERVRMNRKIDEIKQTCQRDMDSLHQRNRNLEREVLELQQSSKAQERMQAVQAQANSAHVNNNDEDHRQEVTQLRHKLHKQDLKWAAKMQKLVEEHEREKGQLHASVADMSCSMLVGKEEERRNVRDLENRLQELQQLVTSQSKQIKQISSSPPTVVPQREVPPEPKPRAVVSVEQFNSVHKLDPIVELSEEDKDSSSMSEGLPSDPGWKHKAEALLKQPGLRKDMQLAVQQSLNLKLLDLGVQSGACRLPKAVYKSVMAKLVSGRQQRQSEDPEYRTVQKEVNRKLEQRTKERTTELSSRPKQTAQALSVAQPRPRSSSLPITVTRVAAGHPPRSQHTPQPANQKRTGPQTSKKAVPPLRQKTPQFSTDEDSSDEDESDEDESETKCPQKASRVNAPQATTSTPKAQPLRSQQRTSPQGTRCTEAVLRHGGLGVSRTEVTAVDSESEWTECSELEEVALERLPKVTDQNGNVQKTFYNHVKPLTKNLEEKLEARDPRKPAEGVNTLPEKPSGVTKTNDLVQELKRVDLNNSDDDWDISSLEDVPVGLRASPTLLRKSAEKSLDTSTSVWGTSTSKGHKPGLNGAGTGSTLKSSIVTVSDWDDSDDI